VRKETAMGGWGWKRVGREEGVATLFFDSVKVGY